MNSLQLEPAPLFGPPGVQTREGGDFNATRNQFVGVSIGGHGGRATRIRVKF